MALEPKEQAGSLPVSNPVAVRLDPGSFLEKRSYRRRRMMDGLRLLPVLALWLFMVPLLWPGASARLTATGVTLSSALVYIFAVWCGLIALCACLSMVQIRQDGPASQDQSDAA